MPSAEQVAWAKFRVAATAVVALLILASLLFLLVGGSLFRPETTLYLYLPDATGVAPGSPVRVDGIQVGKVGKVALSGSSDPNRVVRVTMIVDRDRLASITADSSAQTAADTLVGDKFVQISSGKTSQRMQPGSEIPYKGSPDLVKSLDLSQFRKSLEQMDALLTDIEQGRSPLGQFVMSNQMYSDVTRRLRDLDRAIRTAASTTSSVGHELYTDALYRQVSVPLVQLDRTLVNLQAGQGAAGQFLRDDAQYAQLRSQVVTVRKSVADLRAMDFLKSGAMYDDLNRSVAGWIQKVDQFNVSPMLGTTAVYDNLGGMAKELQQTVKEFRGNPRKFLRLKFF